MATIDTISQHTNIDEHRRHGDDREVNAPVARERRVRQSIRGFVDTGIRAELLDDVDRHRDQRDGKHGAGQPEQHRPGRDGQQDRCRVQLEGLAVDPRGQDVVVELLHDQGHPAHDQRRDHPARREGDQDGDHPGSDRSHQGDEGRSEGEKHGGSPGRRRPGPWWLR